MPPPLLFQIQQGVSQDDINRFIFYSAGVFDNCGNFNSFGDDKFIPEISESTFRAIIQSSHNYKNPNYASLIDNLLQNISPFVFSNLPNQSNNS